MIIATGERRLNLLFENGDGRLEENQDGEFKRQRETSFRPNSRLFPISGRDPQSRSSAVHLSRAEATKRQK